mmetsp:Transcript_33106/g.84936  ORF Transcript_33106/g.84936 Transcript_33106/m.84936 type:complete len:209 (+) Transcript_33106:1483-2109(+)
MASSSYLLPVRKGSEDGATSPQQSGDADTPRSTFSMASEGSTRGADVWATSARRLPKPACAGGAACFVGRPNSPRFPPPTSPPRLPPCSPFLAPRPRPGPRRPPARRPPGGAANPKLHSWDAVKSAAALPPLAPEWTDAPAGCAPMPTAGAMASVRMSATLIAPLRPGVSWQRLLQHALPASRGCTSAHDPFCGKPPRPRASPPATGS